MSVSPVNDFTLKEQTKVDPGTHRPYTEWCLCCTFENNTDEPVKISVSFKGAGRASPSNLSLPANIPIGGTTVDTIPPRFERKTANSSITGPGTKLVCICPIDIETYNEVKSMGGHFVAFYNVLPSGGTSKQDG